MKRRVAITGLGIVSSIGTNSEEVLTSLRENLSGIEAVARWKKYGFKSQVAGTIKLPDIEALRADFDPYGRFMDWSSLYALLCAEEAINDSGLDKEELKGENVACIAGSAFSNSSPFRHAASWLDGRSREITAYEITRSLTNSISGNLSAYYGTRGRSFSIGSACATSVHNVGHAYELIRDGNCNLALAGGAEEVSSMITCMTTGMRKIMSKAYNDCPDRASRPYDKDRDGFVISGGGGMVVLEEYERALQRGAPIHAEIIGFGTSSDGYDVLKPQPEGDGCYRCMDEAIKTADVAPADIDYVNTHGTSTLTGDVVEIKAIDKIFNGHKISLSSTKSLTGHAVGAAGVHELIYCLLMMKHSFITASANIENMDPEFDKYNIDIVTENRPQEIKTVLTNSFGFGGTNGSLVVRN